MTESVECVVVGAGVVGLACARALATSGREVIVLEQHDAIGTETSARNSEVIHAGIYYEKGSLKAQLCVRGRRMLYDYCAAHGVEARKLGKLIVATSEAEREGLDGLLARAEANGVENMQRLTKQEALALEPNLRCEGALLSPETGIVDSHSLMLAYQGDAEAAGAMIAFNSPLEGGRIDGDGILLDVGGATPMRLRCRELVNAGGLHAQKLAGALAGIPAEHVPPIHYAKGNYFALTGKTPFSHLIYPAPGGGGLGVHITIDLAGRGRFGPDVEWVDDLYYPVDSERGDKFYAAIRRYWPELPDGALAADYAGIRPKLTGPDSPKHAADFVIQGPTVHGVPGLVNLFGIESPGLTSSLAIAEHVTGLLDAKPAEAAA